MDLTNIPVPELRELLQRIPQEIKRREAQERAQILNEARAFVKARGYTLEELTGGEVVKQVATRKVAPKYRHPADAALEWTGRGRQPRWVQDWVAQGNTLESLAI